MTRHRIVLEFSTPNPTPAPRAVHEFVTSAFYIQRDKYPQSCALSQLTSLRVLDVLSIPEEEPIQ